MCKNDYNIVSFIRINGHYMRNFLYGVNDLITIFVALECFSYVPTYYLDISREMYGLIKMLQNIYSWMEQALLF